MDAIDIDRVTETGDPSAADSAALDLLSIEVRGVVTAGRFAEIEAAPIGSIVVLDPVLSRDLGGYRFDLALGAAPGGLAAIVGRADAWSEPSLTAKRVADEKGIALGRLREGHDAVSLAIRVHDLVIGEGRNDIALLQQVCELIDGCVDSASIPQLLDDCSAHLDADLRVVDRTDRSDAIPIRVQGVVRQYLITDSSGSAGSAGSRDSADSRDSAEPAEATALVRSACAYLARRVEALQQADYEAHELPMATRSELLNEILLSDAATSADSISRLRQSGFPIDGSHYAIRVDCHDPLPLPVSLQAVNRCQQRLAEILLDGTNDSGGEWTRAGTTNSILIISSLERAHGDLVATQAGQLVGAGLARAAGLFPGLRVHVGVGTPHLGAEGLRTSVTEATTSVRVARARGVVNQAQQFDRLGLGRALVRWAEIDGVRPVINEIMAPLLDQTPRQARQALSTLRAYLDSGQNVTKTAEALHLHRNTARYRLERIAALLPVDMNDPDDRLLLELSCRIVDAELNSTGPADRASGSRGSGDRTR